MFDPHCEYCVDRLFERQHRACTYGHRFSGLVATITFSSLVLFADLRERANRIDVRLTVSTARPGGGAPQVRALGSSLMMQLPTKATVGDFLSLAITPSADCYVYVFNVSTSGALVMVFPNVIEPHNRVAAHATCTLPHPRVRRSTAWWRARRVWRSS